MAGVRVSRAVASKDEESSRWLACFLMRSIVVLLKQFPAQC